VAYDRRREEARFAQPSRRRIDYWVEIGRVHAPVGVERGFAVLDPDRALTLRAWADTLIPARGARPAAGDIGAAEYVDAIAFQAPRVRASLIAAIDRVELMSRDGQGVPFAVADQGARAAILHELEEGDESGIFGVVRDLCYEAYYAHPQVLDTLERETGWRYENAFSGSEMTPFDERLLERMRAVAPSWREA
jgi:hypothetical protein